MAQKTRSWKLYLNIFTIIALLVLIFALRHQIAQVLDNITRINYWALFLMLPLQALNYHAYANLYKSLLGLLEEKVEYKDMYKVQLELNFVNNVFPSGGVSGVSYFGLRMRDFGVRGGKATLTQVMKFGLVFLSFQIMLIFGLLCLVVVGQTSNLTIMVVTIIATLLAVSTVGASYIIGSRSRINAFFGWFTKVINRLIHVVRPHHPETINMERAKILFDELHENYAILKNRWRELKKPLLYALLANITEVLTIYVVYIAFGHYVNIGAVIIAYAVANFAGMISVLPGGVGIYEALMTAVLATAGIPAAVSIPVTVMYRVLNMLIQLPPGYYFYHKAIRPSTVPNE